MRAMGNEMRMVIDAGVRSDLRTPRAVMLNFCHRLRMGEGLGGRSSAIGVRGREQHPSYGMVWVAV